MHILFLTQIVPYPPDAGPKVKTWHVLRYLASQGHQVHLATFLRPEEEDHLPALEQVCASVNPIPLKRSRLADIGYWLRSQWRGRPFLVERDDRQAMRQLVAELLALHPISLIHADQLTMTQFALGPAPGRQPHWPARVFDAHNAVWTILDRLRQNANPVLRPVLALEAWRVRTYEGQVVQRFEHTLAVTEIDRRALQLAAQVNNSPESLPITVVPIAVDTTAQQPLARQPEPGHIVTLGTLHYPPNADGIRWFARQVFPQVVQQLPEARLTIIGKNPPEDFMRLAQEQPDRIRVTGYVAELEPYLARAAAMVVPVRAGGGMRVRLLEAFAFGLPVVTTTIGLEGIAAQPGREVLVADEPDRFAATTVQLLQDPGLQSRLGQAGRRLAEARYDWQVVLKDMDAVYDRLAPQTETL